ncbi:hypothetical protein K443DRAFT_15617 [Laccaria amethystina LaAM-08-1]|uniref:Uncharacterized protein n=1 Tax=Laccaria amethystina LaAM-08-1 TaxID=1095629 RepID=A0A0C9WQJ5_9AGAR|nr:hypothetical protein K443DRAFT_15617 [Laccaria amethystina LaAM-08-1]
MTPTHCRTVSALTNGPRHSQLSTTTHNDDTTPLHGKNDAATPRHLHSKKMMHHSDDGNDVPHRWLRRGNQTMNDDLGHRSSSSSFPQVLPLIFDRPNPVPRRR